VPPLTLGAYAIASATACGGAKRGDLRGKKNATKTERNTKKIFKIIQKKN